MSDFAEQLVASSKSWSSAYIQFATGTGREDYICYAFVEDDDDVIFYQHVLSNIPNVGYIGCGGKSGVLKLFEKLKDEDREKGNLFLVDRDTESLPFTYNEEVLRTEFYSWENHVCQPSLVKWFIQRRTSPNLSIQNSRQLESDWRSTITSFKAALIKQLALVKVADVLKQSLDMNKVSLVRDVVVVGGQVLPSVGVLSWYEEKVTFAISKGASKDQIEGFEAEYAGMNPFVQAHGKTLFSILKKFIPANTNLYQCSYLGEFSSPKHLLALMRWNDASTSYIREYAERRLAA